MDIVHVKLLTLMALLLVVRLGFTFAARLPQAVRHRLMDLCDTALVASAVSLLLVTYVFQFSRVDGDSMLPSLHDSEMTIVNRLIYRLHKPERGDIIVFRPPVADEEEAHRDYIKRVIAKPGETVSIVDGWVMVGSLKLNEPYELERPDYAFPRTLVPKGSLFVMGDNRRNSSDSRVFGCVPYELIRGKASFIFWPISRWGFIQSFRGRRFRG